MIEVKHAQYFVALAEELHFGRAAARLHMTQPPLSQALAQIEQRLGVRLLDRTKRSVQLTLAGRTFAEECKLLIRQSQQAASAVQRVASGSAGNLRIGAVTAALASLLPEAMRALRHRYPLIDVTVSEISTQNGVQLLVDQELDVALVHQPVPGHGCVADPLGEDEFVVAVPANHPLAGATLPLQLEKFKEDVWTWLPREVTASFHDEMASACRQAGFTPHIKHWADSIASEISLVSCGLGVALVPRLSAKASMQSQVAFLEIAESPRFTQLYFMHRDQSEPAIDSLLECLTDSITLLGLGRSEA